MSAGRESASPPCLGTSLPVRIYSICMINVSLTFNSDDNDDFDCNHKNIRSEPTGRTREPSRAFSTGSSNSRWGLCLCFYGNQFLFFIELLWFTQKNSLSSLLVTFAFCSTFNTNVQIHYHSNSGVIILCRHSSLP